MSTPRQRRARRRKRRSQKERARIGAAMVRHSVAVLRPPFSFVIGDIVRKTDPRDDRLYEVAWVHDSVVGLRNPGEKAWREDVLQDELENLTRSELDHYP